MVKLLGALVQLKQLFVVRPAPEFPDQLKLERMASNGEKEVMMNSRFTEKQMVIILREADKTPVAEVAKRHGISEKKSWNHSRHCH